MHLVCAPKGWGWGVLKEQKKEVEINLGYKFILNMSFHRK